MSKGPRTAVMVNSGLVAEAEELGIAVASVAEEALLQAINDARRSQWIGENAAALAAQNEWFERNGHPLAGIMIWPGTPVPE